MGKLTDVAIRAWIKAGERFEGRTDGDGLLLSWRPDRTAPHWRLPTLLLWAGEDLCVNPQGSKAFAQACPPGVLYKRCYRKLYHEIFNEPEQRDVLADLTQWLRRF